MSESVPPLDYDTYSKERTFALEVAREQTKFIDQAVLTLSGGALGVSLTFLEKFVAPGGAVQPALLCVAWGAPAASILAVLVGMHLSQWSIDKHIDNLDGNQRKATATVFENPWAGLTQTLNYFATTLLILGLLSLAVFAYENIPQTLIRG